MNKPNTNTGHGHVWTRPDGIVARCGGPAACAECLADLIAFRQSLVPNPEVLKLIHGNPLVRLLWAHLRLKREAGDNDPLKDGIVANAIRDLKVKYGIKIPAGDDWWREPHWPKP